MVKGALQREWPRHLSTHTHWTLPTTMSVLETPFDIHVSSVYHTHTCMQAPIPTLCISAKKTHNKGSRTRPIMSTLMPRSGIPVICSRATLSCDSSYFLLLLLFFFLQFEGGGGGYGLMLYVPVNNFSINSWVEPVLSDEDKISPPHSWRNSNSRPCHQEFGTLPTELTMLPII